MLFNFTNTFIHVELIYSVVSISIKDVIKYTGCFLRESNSFVCLVSILQQER